ncbi:MAG TPA: Rieske 2Fe-2S domain-containing protein [Alphaproteobacteria bacterium]|nr:Rieske 2Fe-2S domain-containing protein [Alphaproteobacteria bacterium]
MMSREDNEAITRVGPGTPGGSMLRRYWWPVWLSAEVTNKPVPVRLLGEDFILFRDGTGRVGMLDIACPHRRASLALGRVESRGIRCCYHGWLLDADGRCLEMPAEPAGSRLHEDVRQRHARVQEAGGFVFAYLGPDPAPDMPKYDLLFRRDCDRAVWIKEDHCNWAQRAENGVDPYHSMSLHASVYPTMAMKRPEARWDPKWYGFRMQSEYPGGKRNVSHHIFPSTTRRHGARVGTRPSEYLHIRVPIDDTLTYTFYVKANVHPDGPYKTESRGMHRTVRGEWARIEDEWWGLESSDQDRAAQESQGPIHDRTREFLATSDRGVVMWRKLMLDSIKAVAAGGDPHGVRRGASDDIVHFDAGKNFSDHEQALASAT